MVCSVVESSGVRWDGMGCDGVRLDEVQCGGVAKTTYF